MMDDQQQQQFQGLLDMINGGGAGQAGQTFEGGPLSGLLNLLGIRPQGYQDRLAAARPQPRPMMPMPTHAQPAPAAPNPYAPTAITTTTLPPAGQLSDEQLVQMIRQALTAAPSAIGYGPR